jgi:hypothetical protein
MVDGRSSFIVGYGHKVLPVPVRTVGSIIVGRYRAAISGIVPVGGK